MDSNLPRLQLELYKEIKKVRLFRASSGRLAAVSCFREMSSFI